VLEMPRRVLLTGATGAVGPRVVQAFLEAGCAVRTLALDPPVPGMFPDGVDVRTGDILDGEAVAAAMDGMACVVHMAARVHAAGPADAAPEEHERTNAAGTRAVAEAAVRAGVGRLVLFSSIAVYGPGDGRLLDESTPPRPDTPYARTKLEAESIVLTARNREGRPLGTVLRLAAVYGTRIKGNYRRLVQALAAGRFVLVGGGRNRRTLVYDRDAAAAAVLAAASPSAAGLVYNVTDGRTPALNEILAVLCGQLGRRVPRLRLPTGPVRLAAGGIEACARLLRARPPLTRTAVDKLLEDTAVSGGRFRAELGFVPGYDLRAGWAETIAAMRSNGELE
jgi:nucleoside-diphosphate-sugar epimerase